MRAFILFAALMSLTATPSVAADPPKDDRLKIICKGDRILGSLRTQRVCKTKEQWELEKKKAKDTLDFDRAAPAPSDRSMGTGIGG